MIAIHTVAAVRAAEEAAMAGLPEGALMQRAAAALASALVTEVRACRGRLRGACVLVAAGPGNNGGDALWAAVRLLRRGVRVWAWRTGPTVHAAGWAAFTAAGGRETDALGALGLLPDADLVVDGVLGIGGRGGLPAVVATFADACRDTGAHVVAVDLPSGLEADAGRVPASFTAALTVTFGALKACHVLEPARSRCGAVRLVDIGLDPGPAELTGWEPADVATHWPVPHAGSDKYARGVVGVDAGSARYPGAAVLACAGAVHAGAGMVRYLGPAADAVVAALPNVVTAPGRVQAHLIGSGWGERADGPDALAAVLATGLPAVVDAAVLACAGAVHAGAGMVRYLGPAADAVVAALPNVVTAPGRVQAHLIGSGWGERADGPDALAAVLATGLPAVVDADALALLPDGPLGAHVLLTPHAGELGRLLGVARDCVVDDPVGSARRAAAATGAVVLLKGATQYVAEPGGRVTLAVPGPSWTAQAGSGDVLAGICAALLAAGTPAREAALAGASVQALTARAHPGPRPPQDLARLLPDVVAGLAGTPGFRAGSPRW